MDRDGPLTCEDASSIGVQARPAVRGHLEVSAGGQVEVPAGGQVKSRPLARRVEPEPPVEGVNQAPAAALDLVAEATASTLGCGD
jgi:hypothetical protein